MERQSRVIAILLLSVAVLVVLVLKIVVPGGSNSGTGPDSVQARIASAKKEELPAWLLFHSQTCQSCVEMTRLFEALEPEYAGKIAFIEADVDDPQVEGLLHDLNVRYIPTTFLVNRRGEIVESYVGVLSESDMRAKLDKLFSTGETSI